MKPIFIQDHSLEIRLITQADLDVALAVYQQCEDFLALGPVATASMEMVQKDIQISQGEGGLFCGIFNADGKMIGVVDFVLSGFKGDSHAAFISLLMIAALFRSQGIGQAVLEAVENEIKKDANVTVILLGVQVNNPNAARFWQRHGYRIISGPILLPDQTTAYQLRKDIIQ